MASDNRGAFRLLTLLLSRAALSWGPSFFSSRLAVWTRQGLVTFPQMIRAVNPDTSWGMHVCYEYDASYLLSLGSGLSYNQGGFPKGPSFKMSASLGPFTDYQPIPDRRACPRAKDVNR